MKINSRKIYLKILFILLITLTPNVIIANALEVGKLTNVTSNILSNSIPVWSPNGNEILFSKEGGLYKAFSNGTGEKKLTSTESIAYSWSPDGSKILYSIPGELELSDEVWIMNSDGSEKKQLIKSEWKIEHTFTWFPSGKIAYVPVYDGYIGFNLGVIDQNGYDLYSPGYTGIVHLYAISPDESKMTYLTNDNKIGISSLNKQGNSTLFSGLSVDQTQSGQSQVWSPNSSKIVYYSYGNKNWDIHTINANGTGKTQLTSNKSNDISPIFSPDGNKIAFESNVNGNKDIWIMDSDGKNKTQITNDSASESRPVWSPDGTKIAFCSAKGKNYSIYTLTLVENKNLPVANFLASTNSGTAPLNVTFTDTSTGIPNTWKWNFGDGNNSTKKCPKHIYSTAGNYTVTLKVNNPVGSNIVTKSSFVLVGKTKETQKPVASFWGSRISGKAPLNVTFTDASTNTPTAWNWSFGDGTYSTQKKPKHTYNKAGKYTVSLTVKNEKGSNIKKRCGYILVSEK